MQSLIMNRDDVDSLTSDGRVIHIRDLGADDAAALAALHEGSSERSIYLRFFNANREVALRYMLSLAEPHEGRNVLGAFVGTDLVGVGVADRATDGTASAEFALLVADEEQHAGIGTLLLEHLIAEARGAGVQRLTADVLAANALMLQVIRDLGFTPEITSSFGEVHVEFALEVDETLVDAIAQREAEAGAASLRPLLAPRSVAVVGAGHRPNTVGHELLRNILAAGFPGPIYVVNPKRRKVLGVPCVPTPAELPEAVDLAVIALPAPLVADSVAACGARGVQAAILISAGFAEAGAEGAKRQNEVLAIGRRHGMRMVGPNCLGVVNADPDVRLNATFARVSPHPGRFAVLAQSGAFGAALLSAAETVGLGVCQFVSIGNKIDVGGNDLLLAWGHDPAVKVIGGYLESVGDPRRFLRIAQRVSRQKPVLMVKSGRTEAGRRAGRSHTAAAASPDVAIDALFRASGVVRMDTMEALLNAARVLADQPLPAGPRVAIVGNSGGPEILAADAAVNAGLTVPEFDVATAAMLVTLGASGQNPLDLGAQAQPELVEKVLATLSTSPAVDVLLTVFTDVAVSDGDAILATVGEVAASAAKPMVAVRVGCPPTTYVPRNGGRDLPVFAFPEEAAAALGVAQGYAHSRAKPLEVPPRPADAQPEAARKVVSAALAQRREWLTPEDVGEVLDAYGIPRCPQQVITNEKAALAAATRLGYPVVAKLAGAGVHKTDTGGVRLGIADADELRAAVDELARLGNGRVLIQPMVRGGTELIIGAIHDEQCGPLVMVGAGGVLTDVLKDRTFGLAPLTPADAGEMLDGLRSARLLDGYRGAPVVSRADIVDVLVRVGALVDDVPAIAELDLNPLIATSAGVQVVDARVRVAEPPHHPDPLVRQLRGPNEETVT